LGTNRHILPVYHAGMVETPANLVLPSLGEHKLDYKQKAMITMMPLLPFSLAAVIASRVNATSGVHDATVSGTTSRALLSEGEVIHLGQQLASGLLHVQNHRMVHRSVTPESIFLLPPSSVMIDSSLSSSPLDTKVMSPAVMCQTLLVIGDFGDALDMAETEPTPPPAICDFKMTFDMTGTSKGGDPSYLPPEVLAVQIGKTDMHSFPTLLFTILS
jgi:serine/threonine protein kinase